MTCARRYGEDVPFGQWVRSRQNLHSIQHSLTVNDADWIFHKYRTNVDSIGTREVQCMMFVEVKTNLAKPNISQQETLYFIHQRMKWDGDLRRIGGSKVAVRNFGVFVLCLVGVQPTDASEMLWGSFDGDGHIQWKYLHGESQLDRVLGFDIDPCNLVDIKHTLRRHHKTRQLIASEYNKFLGTNIDRIVIQRS